ncbi:MULTISPECIES: aldo/keto reductase [Pseudooceanicola]|uniref:aldo/keto reductase n=1 Tax=Pseudooceanicola TaxID=1679449 RepID=UPI0035CC9853
MIRDAAARTGKTPAQVILRWHLQLGVSVLTRTTRPERLEMNFDLFDFSLTAGEMAGIAELDEGRRTGPNPLTFETP